MQWWRWFRELLRPSILRRSQHECDLDDEIRFDLAEETRLRINRGESPDSAQAAASRDFGRVARIKEETREIWGWTLLDRIAQDLRFALRAFSKSPAFTLAAVVTVGLGIGLCCFLFSVLYGFLLRPSPGVRQPGQLLALETPVPYPYFERYRDNHEVTAEAAAFIGPVPFGVAAPDSGGSRTERVTGHLVSPEYFSTLGVEPLLGRLFSPAAERRGAPPTVVVSERFWRTRLSSDSNAAGRTLRINGHQATIVGVTQPEFLGVFPAPAADIFLPVTADADIAPELSGGLLDSTASSPFRVVLRLAPRMTVAAAETALDAQTRGFEQQERKRDAVTDNRARLVSLIPASSVVPWSRQQRSAFSFMYGLLMALILTFTCANLAGLILARGKARGREIAIRLSLGAGRRRLIRQLLTESILLATLGGLTGLAAAYGLLQLLVRSQPASETTSAFTLTPDLRVALLTCAISAVAGVGFGLLPALATTRPDLITGLKDTAAAVAGRYRRFGLRNLFMVYQMGAAMALVLVTGFMLSSLRRGANQAPGFDPNGLYLFSIDPPRDGYSPEESAAILVQLWERLAQLQTVDRATLIDRTPYATIAPGPTTSVSITDDGGRESLHRPVLQTVGPAYFATLGVQVLRGVEFTGRELRTDPADILPAILNQAAATEFFGDADALGRTFRQEEKVFQVAAVVSNDKPALFTNEAPPTVSVPLTMQDLHRGSPQGFSVMLRAREHFDFAIVRKELEAIDSRLTLFNQQTMQENLARFQQGVSIASSIYAVIGAFALVLACVGLAGVTANAVVRRRKEIGIRMALGARHAQVIRMVMREGAALVLIGSALGFAVGFAITRVVASISPQAADGGILSASDPARIVIAPLLLLAVAAIACYLPARRSTGVDPLTALREE